MFAFTARKIKKIKHFEEKASDKFKNLPPLLFGCRSTYACQQTSNPSRDQVPFKQEAMWTGPWNEKDLFL